MKSKIKLKKFIKKDFWVKKYFLIKQLIKDKIINSIPLLKDKMLKELPFILFFIVVLIFFNKFTYLARNSQGEFLIYKIFSAMENIKYILKTPLLSLNKIDLLVSLVATSLLFLYFYIFPRKKFRTGVEYGSAKWGNTNDIHPYIDHIPKNNIILSQTERLTMNARPKNIATARNKNVVVIGGSGSGKTRFFIKPNIMQMHSSYVITDPKGTLLLECGKMLEKNGYKIKVFNTIDFLKSMRYNPFNYIKTEEDIITFVNTLIMNTQNEGQNMDFWVNAEKMYFSALIGYIISECPDDEKNISSLLRLLENSEIPEDENDKNVVDLLMEELEEKDPNNFAIKQYRKYKTGAKQTLQSILISCGIRLSPFDTKILGELMSTDDLNLESLGDEKTALFIILSDTNPTFNFIVSIMYTQLFNLLCERADNKYGGRLPVHVRFLLDEFANIGKIPNFDKLIATIRSREISACPILQTKSQLKNMYKDNAETIIGNCDTLVFLGGGEETTLKDMSEILGKETIDVLTTSDSRGTSVSFGANFQKTGRELMTKDELSIMPRNKCIVKISGVKPFLSNKYDITKHKQYKNLSDLNKENIFDIERYLKDFQNPEFNLNADDKIIHIDIDEENI